MYCTNCGHKLDIDSKFCTKCGHITSSEKEEAKIPNHYWTRRKSYFLIFFSIILTLILTAFTSLFIFGSSMISTEDQAVNIMTHLIEQSGRQASAWDKTQQTIDIIRYAFTDECFSSSQCLSDAGDEVTALEAQVTKEREEIQNLWSTGGVSQDFEEFYNQLEPENQQKIHEIINTYFPEESEELETSAEYL